MGKCLFSCWIYDNHLILHLTNSTPGPGISISENIVCLTLLVEVEIDNQIALVLLLLYKQKQEFLLCVTLLKILSSFKNVLLILAVQVQNPHHAFHATV